MDPLLTTAAGGLRSRTEALELVANNLSNSDTAGYKADREFHSTYISADSLDGPEGSLPPVTPMIETNWIDFGNGTSVATGNPLDVSLTTNGFLVVSGSRGRFYTRNGNLQLGAEGTLRSQAGDQVLGVDDKPIRVEPLKSVQISIDGTVRQEDRVVGKLASVDFTNRQELRKAGGTYFRWDNSTDAPKAVTASFEQGRLESANFQPADSAIHLVNVMRQFETLQRAISMGNEINKRAIEEVAKI